MKNEISGSIVAQDNSSISSSNLYTENSVRKIKIRHTIVGFVLGIVSELIAMIIYYNFLKK